MSTLASDGYTTTNALSFAVNSDINKSQSSHYSFSDFRHFCYSKRGELLLSLVFLLIGYGQKIVSNTFSIDTEGIISRSDATYGSWIRLERFGLLVFKYITGRYWYNNALAGILMAIILFLASTSWAYLFSKSSNKISTYHPAFFMIPFICAPIIAEMLGFLLMGDDVATAIALVSVALMLVHNSFNSKHRWLMLAGSVIVTTIAFTIYLATVTIFITGTVMVILRNHNKHDDSLMDSLRCIGVYAGTFMLSYVCYAILNKLALIIAHVNTDPYIKEQMRWGKDSILHIFNVITLHAIDIYTGRGIFYSGFITIALAAMLAIAITNVIQKKSNIVSILFIVLIIISPLMMSVILGTKGVARTELAYPLASAFAILFVLEWITTLQWKQIALGISWILLIVVGFSQASIVNRMYYTEQMVYQQDAYLAHRIVERIEQIQSKGHTLPVIFVGNHIANNNPDMFAQHQLELIGRSMLEVGFSTQHGTWVKQAFIHASTGTQLALPQDASLYKAADKESTTMPSWPAKDSVKIVDNQYIIVKF